MAQQTPARQTLSPSIKAQLTKQLADHKITIDDVCDKYKVQKYQVYAWLGQSMLKGAFNPEAADKASQPSTPPTIPSPDPAPQASELQARKENAILSLSRLDQPSRSAAIDPELARIVGEWFLREVLPKKLAEADNS
jgi:transposase-like protein